MNKKLISAFLILLLIILMNYLLLTRDGSIKLGLILSGYNPFITYENIDYENGISYLNPIEINNEIIYFECKSYGLIKVAHLYKFN